MTTLQNRTHRTEIDDEYAIRVVEGLVSLPSESGEEEAVSRWTAAELRRLGLDVLEQEVLPRRGNVLAALDTGRPGPVLLFNGHLDTLPIPAGWSGDPFTPQRVDGRLFGAEITNMKAAVGGMIACMAALRREQARLTGRIVLSAVIGECDALGLGTMYMLHEGLRADMAINGEPTDLSVLTAHSGVTQLRLCVRGKSVHVSQRDTGQNAIEGLVAALGVLDETVLRFERNEEFPGLPTVNVGVIRGGRIASMLAEQAEALIDVRTVPGMTPEGVRDNIAEALRTLTTRNGKPFDVEVQLLTPPQFCQQYPYHVAASEPIVQAVAAAHEAVRGRRPHVGSLYPQVFFGTDASHLLRAGIPTVIYGPGKAADINVPNESMAIADFLDAARVYLLSALAICGER